MFQSLERDSAWSKYALTLIASLLALLKPVLALAIVPVAVVLWISSTRKQWLIALSFFGLVIISWNSFNFYRQGSFSLSPYGKFSLFGVAALIGSAEISDKDEPLIKKFVSFANLHKFPAAGSEEEWMQDIRRTYRQEKYDHNLWLVAEKFRVLNGLSKAELTNQTEI